MELSRVIRELYSYRKPNVQTSFGFFQTLSQYFYYVGYFIDKYVYNSSQPM